LNREDFEILKNNIIYFDNGATTLKPKMLLKGLGEYYNEYCSNIHRGDYDISLKASDEYEYAREKVAKFINASSNEIIFTAGATDSLNKVIFGYFKNVLKANDEVLVTKSEHASNLLPWYELEDEIGIKIKYIHLDEKHEVTLKNLEKEITSNTKVISIAHVSNAIGDVRDIKSITKIAHDKGILVLVDGAQSVPHMKVNVKEIDADFLVFSAHKMCGPTGLGILYGKMDYLKNIKPIIFGGGMNASFGDDGFRMYKDLPERLEAGTPNIGGAIAFGKIIEYLENIGMDNIHKYELELKRYLISKLKENKNIIIYNENTESGIITINYKDIFAQDLSIYLNKYGICTRAGNHCAKILKDEIGMKNTCRISLYFYNTKEEIDKLIDVLNNPNIKNEII